MDDSPRGPALCQQPGLLKSFPCRRACPGLACQLLAASPTNFGAIKLRGGSPPGEEGSWSSNLSLRICRRCGWRRDQYRSGRCRHRSQICETGLELPTGETCSLIRKSESDGEPDATQELLSPREPLSLECVRPWWALTPESEPRTNCRIVRRRLVPAKTGPSQDCSTSICLRLEGFSFPPSTGGDRRWAYTFSLDMACARMDCDTPRETSVHGVVTSGVLQEGGLRWLTQPSVAPFEPREGGSENSEKLSLSSVASPGTLVEPDRSHTGRECQYPSPGLLCPLPIHFVIAEWRTSRSRLSINFQNLAFGCGVWSTLTSKLAKEVDVYHGIYFS